MIHMHSFYTLLLPGQMGEAWKPSKKESCFGSLVALYWRVLLTFFFKELNKNKVNETEDALLG
jgi:hypothetical protein